MTRTSPTTKTPRAPHRLDDARLPLLAISAIAVPVAFGLGFTLAISTGFGCPDPAVAEPAMREGTYLMRGPQLPRTTWVSPGGPDCQWAAYAGINDGQPTATGSGAGRQVVNLEADQSVLRTHACGTWVIA